MIETKENKKSLNNCFRILKSEVLELKEILKIIDNNNKIALNNDIQIINLNNQLIFNINKLDNSRIGYSYQFTIILKLSCYNDLNQAFSLNRSCFLTDLIGIYDLLIDFNNKCLKMNTIKDNVNIIEKTRMNYNNNTVLDLDNFIDIDTLDLLNKNNSFEIIETNKFIVYTSSQQKELLKELSLIDNNKLKSKKLYSQIKDSLPSNNLSSLKKEKFNLDKFKEYIASGILETSFEDLETNKIEYLYKVERSNFYKEYEIVFNKYSFDEIRNIILKEYDLFSMFYYDFIRSENKYTSINSYLIENFESLKNELLNLEFKEILSFELISMIDKHKEEVKIKEIYNNLSKELFAGIIKNDTLILSLDLVDRFLKTKNQDKNIVHNLIYNEVLEKFKSLYDRMTLESNYIIDNTNKLSKHLDFMYSINTNLYKVTYSKVKKYCENILNLKGI